MSNKTREISTIFPLHIHSPTHRAPNLAPEFVSAFASAVGLRFVTDGAGDLEETFGPEDIFHYLYAVLHSPEYRRRYAEFLKSDYARVPLPGSRAMFADLVGPGARLVSLHLMVPQEDASARAAFPVDGDNTVDKVRYDAPSDTVSGRVWINRMQYFDNVGPETWRFPIGGYQPAQKWLKDRKGRQLSSQDIEHYCTMVAALGETGYRMTEIDTIIDKYGGWPAAFEPAEPEAPRIVPFRPLIDQRYVNCVPLIPLEAAAGGFGDQQHLMSTIEEYEDDEWVAIDSRHRLRRGMFVSRVVGRSMEPLIPDGALCLFRHPVEGTREGKTLLVGLADEIDPETGDRYTVKRYTSEKAESDDDESWRHTTITLKPINPEYGPIVLTPEDEGAVGVVAEFVEVVGHDS